MKNLAIIPARSGSKGLKDKNIKELNKKPLIYYAIKEAKKSNMFDEIMLSTDSVLYADIGKKLGASVPFLRDDNLSTDTASTWDVVKDVLKRYEEKNIYFDTVCILQPTSPLRISDDIVKSYDMFKEKDANFVVSVCEMDHCPLWSNTLDDTLSMENFIDKNIIQMPRQELPTYYRINGAVYIIKTKYLFEAKDIYSSKSYAYIMPKTRSIDIDDIVDFKLAGILLDEYNR